MIKTPGGITPAGCGYLLLLLGLDHFTPHGDAEDHHGLGDAITDKIFDGTAAGGDGADGNAVDGPQVVDDGQTTENGDQLGHKGVFHRKFLAFGLFSIIPQSVNNARDKKGKNVN